MLFYALSVGCATDKLSVHNTQEPEETVPETTITVSEFTLGPGDILDISVWGIADLNKKILVGPTGYISFPFVGDIKAQGKSIFQLRDEIIAGLSESFVDPQVSVNITSNKSQKVFVLGEVNRPGIFQLPGPISVIEAISMANGFTRDAKERTVLLIRGDIENPELKTLDLYATLKKGDIAHNVNIRPGDIIYVPTTIIASAGRYFQHIYNIIRPIVTLEYGVALYPAAEAAIKGEPQEIPIILRPPY